VIIAVYAKKYDPAQSHVKLSPVRLDLSVYFPEEGGSFNLDVELAGVVDVSQCSANMMGSKLEVHLKKAEPGSWSRLYFPKQEPEVKKPVAQPAEDLLNEDFENVDLSDL
jgi:cysteine and histidine-rich domain-containing protein